MRLKNIIGTERVLITALSLCIAGESGFSQWAFIGGPQGLYSNDVLFTKSGRLISSTWQQGVFVSDDSGSTWQNKNVSSTVGGVFSMTQRSNNDLLAITRLGIARSTDEGESWGMIFQKYALNDYGVRLWESPVDSSLYYGADRQVYKSTDGGRNWSQIWNGPDIIDGYALDDSGRVYLGLRSAQLLRSTDGGVSFVPMVLPAPIAGTGISTIVPAKTGGLFLVANVYADYSIYYLESGRAFPVQNGWLNPPLGLASNGNLIYKANHCIAEYNPVTKHSSILSCPSFVRDQFAKRVVTRQNTWVANFSSEGLHRSTDGGVTWTEINRGRGYKQVLSFEITQQGKIVASAFGDAFWGGLFQSIDDGGTWTRVDPQNIDAYFIDISTLRNGNLIANGSYGVYIGDGEGAQWTPRTEISLAYAQYVSKHGEIFVGNDDNGIYKSADNGNSWGPANNGIQHSYFFGFGESCTGRIFAAAWPEGTYYSDDRGAHWTYIASGILSYERAFDFKCRNDTVFAGTSSGVACSTDNGTTWYQCTGFYGAVNEIAIAPNGEILAAVNGVDIYRSRTNGRTWEPFGGGLANKNIWELSFDRSGRLFAATDSGIFRLDNYRTRPVLVSPANRATNQPALIGLRWNSINSCRRYFLQVSEDSLFTNPLVNDSTLVDTMHVVGPLAFLTTYYWRVAGLFSSGGISFSEANKFTTSVPAVFSLRQNYPNPFNLETTIILDVPATSQVLVRVYNMLGQVVTMIANRQFPPGSHKLIWNTSGLSTGVYFYRLEVGGFSQTRKALLLR